MTSTPAASEKKKTERFLPYPYAKFGLEFSLERVIVDAVDRRSSADEQARLIALEERQPHRVEIDVVVRVDPETIAELIPPEELDDPPLGLFIAVRCPKTRLRRRTPLSPLSPQAAEFSGRVELLIDDVRGNVELQPFLVRTRDGRSARHARHHGARLASARPWIVRFDVDRDPQGRFLDVRYEPFSKMPDAARWGQALYRLECELDSPILWLNSDHRELTAILDTKATRGPAARMRDVFFAQIAHSVWTQLFMAAAEHSALEGGARYAWCESVLRKFLGAVFPDLSDHASRLEELATYVKAGSIGELNRRLDRALQDDLKISQQMKALVMETGD